MNSHIPFWRIPFRLSSDRPALTPPADGRIITHFVINVEYWPFEQQMPRTLLPAPHGQHAVPDVPNFSWVDYGMRSGLPRLMQVLQGHGLPASVAINASVIDAYPRAAEVLRDAGWEFIGHGVDQVPMQRVDDEDATVAEALARLERFTGVRPTGWLGPGLHETVQTPDVLARHGVEYLFDWVVDDLPSWLRTADGWMLSLPYSLELNDSVLHAAQINPSDVIATRVQDTLDVFTQEAATTTRVLTIPLHPHLMGVPHRIKHFATAVQALVDHPDVCFMTGAGIADWYRNAEPTPDRH